MTSSAIKSQRYRGRRRRYEVTLGVLGALGGGGLGLAVAGGVGLGVGVVLGGAAAALGAWATQRQEEEMAERDSQLDIEIGVDDGDIGVPGLEHPPAKVGAFSKEVSGAGSATETAPSSGPFERPPGT